MVSTFTVQVSIHNLADKDLSESRLQKWVKCIAGRREWQNCNTEDLLNNLHFLVFAYKIEDHSSSSSI